MENARANGKIRSSVVLILSSSLSTLYSFPKLSSNHNCLKTSACLSFLLQVSSAVPEGKGVSSSASIEVASMSAIAASHGKTF